MIRLKLVAVLSLLVGLNSADANESSPEAVADVARMQGDWMIAEIKQNGIKDPPEDAQTLFRTVSGDKYSIFRYSKKISEGTFKVDPSQSPKTIDSTPASTPGGPPILGIYEFDGEKLRVCNAPPGKPRPKDFGCRLGSMQTLIVWEREQATP